MYGSKYAEVKVEVKVQATRCRIKHKKRWTEGAEGLKGLSGRLQVSRDNDNGGDDAL